VRRLRRYGLRSEWDVRDGANGYRRENRSRGLIWNRGGGRSRRLIRREDTCWSNRDVFSLNWIVVVVVVAVLLQEIEKK
jgi:hypothetical protein